MANTPVYGWPYQTRADAPDGPALGANLALAVEATVAANDAARSSGDAALALLAPSYSSRQILSGTAASVAFTSIPSTLRRLQLIYSARGDAVTQVQQLFYQINASAAAVYNYEYLQGNNAAASAANGAATTKGVCGVVTGASASANVFGSGNAEWQGWDSPHSGGLSMTFIGQGLGTTAANFFTQSGGGIYLAAGPYTRLDLSPTSGNFVAGSDFQLLGWAS